MRTSNKYCKQLLTFGEFIWNLQKNIMLSFSTTFGYENSFNNRKMHTVHLKTNKMKPQYYTIVQQLYFVNTVYTGSHIGLHIM